MITLIIFLVVISVLIFVHELGHFVMAKRSGMRVEEFGFGFPPRLGGIRRGETLYSLNWIPFGGFVKIYGEDGEHRNAPGSFGHGTFWQKTAVIVAGVVMNFLFACVLLVIANGIGLRVGVFDAQTAAVATNQEVLVLDVAPDSPAQAAGLQSLDDIVGFKADGTFTAIATPEEVQQFAYAHAGTDATIQVRRGSQLVELPLHLREATGPTQGPIGISLVLTGIIRYPWGQALWRGFASGGTLFVAVLGGYWQLLSSLFTTGHVGADVTGPVGIATLTGQAARVGFSYLIGFVAMISVNLAVLNILPFPALDGGRLVLIIAEKIRGRALSHHIEGAINAAGFIILIALMVAVTVRDVIHFF